MRINWLYLTDLLSILFKLFTNINYYEFNQFTRRVC